jgi:hypothetical protein
VVNDNDFIITSAGYKKFMMTCRICGSKKGYQRKNSKNINNVCNRCKLNKLHSDNKKFIPNQAYSCSFCNKDHFVPEYGTSTEELKWCKSNSRSRGGDWVCAQKLQKKFNNYKETVLYKQKTQRSNKKFYSNNKLRCCVSSLIYQKLKQRESGKTANIGAMFASLGYSLNDLKQHLESKFEPGMSWNNYGEWHVDHIVPDSWFKYKTPSDEDFKKSWSLDNLQPKWAKDNFKKGNRFEG